MRLIDADALKKTIPATRADIFENCRNCKLLDDFMVVELIDAAPTIDAVPVIRCKDCRWRNSNDICEYQFAVTLDDWFCWAGEKKELSLENKTSDNDDVEQCSRRERKVLKNDTH